MNEVNERSKPTTAVRLEAGERFPEITTSRLGGGRIALAVYSSGAVGRLPARDVLGLIDYVKRQER